jgi:hypothetical protein
VGDQLKEYLKFGVTYFSCRSERIEKSPKKYRADRKVSGVKNAGDFTVVPVCTFISCLKSTDRSF